MDTVKVDAEMFALYPLGQFVQIAAIVSFGSLVQSAIGFGFAIFSMPLLLCVGLTLQEAIFITLACQIVQEVAGLCCVKNRTPVRELWVVMVSGAVFLIIGMMLLKKIEQLDVIHLRRIVSVVILLSIMIEVFCRPHRRKGLSKFWGILAGSAAGIMTGTIGITGPPVVLWVMAQDWSNQRMRSSIWMIFLSIMVPLLVLFGLFYRESFAMSFFSSVLLIPLVLSFSALGVFLGNKIEKKTLRVIAYVLLVIVVLSSLIGK